MAKHKRPQRPPTQKKPPLTHFLCLPLVTPTSKPQLEASLVKFRDDVTSSTPEAAEGEEKSNEAVAPFVHPKAIRPVGALHCTLGVMSLQPDELTAATQLLQDLNVQELLSQALSSPKAEGASGAEQPSDRPASLQRPITPPQVERLGAPLTIQLKGIESMHAPEKTSILYAAPFDTSGRLFPFCLALQTLFKDHGFLVEDNRELKLHATILNTIYTKGRKLPQQQGFDRSAGHGPSANAPLKIDATQILERYRDFVWAEDVVPNRVAICEMGAKKVLDEQGNVKAEEYTEVASVSLSP